MSSVWSFERQNDSVVLLRMNSNKLNVLTNAFMSEFNAALNRLEKEFPNDALVLTGNGRAFSAGLDLKFVTECFIDKKMDDLLTYLLNYEALIYRLYTLPRPVVAAIEGHAIAGGTCIAACCDFRLSNGKGSFGMNEVRNGMPLPHNIFNIVCSAVSKKASQEMFLTGSLYNAEQALKLGIVDEIVSESELIAKAVDKATYSEESLKAYAQIKGLLKANCVATMDKAKSLGLSEDIMRKFYGVPKL